MQWLVQCHSAAVQLAARTDAVRLQSIAYEQHEKQRRVTTYQNCILLLTASIITPIAIDVIFAFEFMRVVYLFKTLWDSVVAVWEAASAAVS